MLRCRFASAITYATIYAAMLLFSFAIRLPAPCRLFAYFSPPLPCRDADASYRYHATIWLRCCRHAAIDAASAAPLPLSTMPLHAILQYFRHAAALLIYAMLLPRFTLFSDTSAMPYYAAAAAIDFRYAFDVAPAIAAAAAAAASPLFFDIACFAAFRRFFSPLVRCLI